MMIGSAIVVRVRTWALVLVRKSARVTPSVAPVGWAGPMK